MHKPRLIVQLSEEEARLILWACIAGYDQLRKFLRHSDWDDGMTKKERHKAMQVDRDFTKAINLIADRLGE